MEQQIPVIPVSGIDRIHAHPCKFCGRAKALIDSRNHAWMWCTHLQISVQDRTETCHRYDPDPDSPGCPAALGRGLMIVSATEEEAVQYVRDQAVAQTLAALNRRPGSWTGAWGVREVTGLEYWSIDEALNTLVARGAVETQTVPSGTLYRVAAAI